MQGFIYKVTNKINGKVYIGQTIQSVKNRWYRHCGKSGISEEEKRMYIKRAILKYGKENFKVETLEECDSSMLDEREKYYISYYDSYNKGYNSTLGGQWGAKAFSTSEKENEDIISLYKCGFSLREIAKEYSIDKATVKGILTRHNIALRNTRTVKFSQYMRQDIINKINSGVTRKEVMREYHISKSYLSQLISGKRRI